MYSTHEFANLTGVTVKALRHYERMGCWRQIATDLAGDRARALPARWRETVDPETLAALTRRARWPDGMRRYVASLYETTPDIWERIVGFVEAQGTR